MTREERLLAVAGAQSEIVAAGLDAAAAMALVAERAFEVTGADGAEIRLRTGERVSCGQAPAGGSHRTSVPLLRAGAQVGEISVHAVDAGRLGADAGEMLTLLAGVLAPHTAGTSVPDSTDRLTGLATWAALQQRLSLECARQARDGGDLTLVYADVDGIEAGDGALRTIAAVLRRWTRAVDGVYRVGGDAFALVLPGASSEAAALLMNRVALQLLDAHPFNLTLTCGIASAPDGGPEQMFAAAESRCRAAKLAAHGRAA